MTPSKDFESLKERFDKGWVTLDQLRRFVPKKITAEEFEIISGVPFK